MNQPHVSAKPSRAFENMCVTRCHRQILARSRRARVGSRGAAVVSQVPLPPAAFGCKRRAEDDDEINQGAPTESQSRKCNTFLLSLEVNC